MPHLSHSNSYGMDYKSQRTSLHNLLQLPLISTLLGLNIMTLSFNYVSLCCALNMRDQVSQPKKNNWHKILNWVLVIIPRIQSTLNFFMNASSSQRHKDTKKKHCSFKCNCWKFTWKGEYKVGRRIILKVYDIMDNRCSCFLWHVARNPKCSKQMCKF